MRLKSWYRSLLIVWMPLGPLVFILSWGFAGEAPWKGLPAMLKSEYLDPLSKTLTLLVWGALASPLILLPFGITRKAAP